MRAKQFQNILANAKGGKFLSASEMRLLDEIEQLLAQSSLDGDKAVLDDFAPKAFGITSRRYRQIAQEGHLPMAEHGIISKTQATMAWTKYIRDRRDVEKTTLSAEKKRITTAQADHREWILEVAKGKFLEADPAMSEWGTVIQGFRTRLLSMPTKISPLLLG